MKNQDDPRPEVLSYGREQPKPPPSPALRLLQLTGYAVVGFVVYVAALIGATSSASPLPLRIGCTTIVFAPVIGSVLFIVLSLLVSVRQTYAEIRQITEPRARRRKIVGVIASSLFLSAFAAGYLWLRVESDRYTARHAADAAPPHPSPTLPPTSSSTGAAARTLHRLINDSPVIIPSPAATTRAAPPAWPKP